MREPVTENDAREHQADADDRSLTDPSRPHLHPETRQESRGDRHNDREHSPGTLTQGVHHHNRYAGQGGYYDKERGHGRRDPGDRPQHLPSNPGQRLPVVPNGGQEHHKVVDTPGQAGPENNPDEARKITPLRCEHRADQWSRARNGGEMDAEEHQPIGGLIVNIVAKPMGGRGPAIIQYRHFSRQERSISPVRHGEGRQGRNHQPQ